MVCRSFEGRGQMDVVEVVVSVQYALEGVTALWLEVARGVET